MTINSRALPIVPSWHADAECACGHERDDTEEDA